MAKNFSPSEIRRVQVELLDGSNVELSQADVYEMMNRGGGGSDVQQLADGATALSGLMTTYQDARYRDDEYYARRKLAKANQAYVNELRKQPNGQALAAAFIDQCSAQEKLDRAQDLINRQQDMAVLVNSGSAAAKALLTKGGQSYGAGISTEEFLLGGVGIWAGTRLLTDGGRRRYKDDEDDKDDEDLGVSTVPK
jgi:hypothetical protein